jgi:hypothetical protein
MQHRYATSRLLNQPTYRAHAARRLTTLAASHRTLSATVWRARARTGTSASWKCRRLLTLRTAGHPAGGDRDHRSRRYLCLCVLSCDSVASVTQAQLPLRLAPLRACTHPGSPCILRQPSLCTTHTATRPVDASRPAVLHRHGASFPG